MYDSFSQKKRNEWKDPTRNGVSQLHRDRFYLIWFSTGCLEKITEAFFFYSRTRLTLIWMRKLLHYYYYCILYLNSFNARPAEVDDLLGDRFRCHTCCSLFSVIIFLVLFQYILARGSQRGAHLLHPAAGGAGVIGWLGTGMDGLEFAPFCQEWRKWNAVGAARRNNYTASA